jgi:DNA-binding MarR family transcriptional regulator
MKTISNEQVQVIAEANDLITGRIKCALIRAKQEGTHERPLTDFSSRQIHVCMLLRKIGTAGLAELAEEFDVTPSAMSVMVDRLVKKGVLCRTRCEEDRRKVEISVSPSARAAIEHGDNIIKNVILEIAEKIGPDTSDQWYGLMKRIKEVFEEQGW